MKKVILLTLSIAVLGACNIKKEEKGEMPDVDVNVTADAGELPEYEVNWADVEVGTSTKTLDIPKVVIVMEEETVEVPFIDVDMPDGSEKTERTIMVEAEVVNKEHNLEIVEIWAAGDELYVVSKLEATDTSIGDKTMRVSDQVTLNAPELTVKHYIMGKRPEKVFNMRYDYITNIDALKASLNDYTIIYSK